MEFWRSILYHEDKHVNLEEDLSAGTADQTIKSVETELNLRPRKILDYFDPNELLAWFIVNPGKNIHDFYQSIPIIAEELKFQKKAS